MKALFQSRVRNTLPGGMAAVGRPVTGVRPAAGRGPGSYAHVNAVAEALRDWDPAEECEELAISPVGNVSFVVRVRDGRGDRFATEREIADRPELAPPAGAPARGCITLGRPTAGPLAGTYFTDLVAAAGALRRALVDVVRPGTMTQFALPGQLHWMTLEHVGTVMTVALCDRRGNVTGRRAYPAADFLRGVVLATSRLAAFFRDRGMASEADQIELRPA